MSLSGIITQGFKNLHNDAIDALLETTALTVPCQLVYGGSADTECDNCLVNHMTRKSTGVYRFGGPIPFPKGKTCPRCSGYGTIKQENTETIYLAVIWDYKNFINVSNNLVIPEGMIQTICRNIYYDNLKRCKFLYADTNISAYEKQKFQRDGEFDFAGLGSSRYVIGMWKRVG